MQQSTQFFLAFVFESSYGTERKLQLLGHFTLGHFRQVERADHGPPTLRQRAQGRANRANIFLPQKRFFGLRTGVRPEQGIDYRIHFISFGKPFGYCNCLHSARAPPAHVQGVIHRNRLQPGPEACLALQRIYAQPSTQECLRGRVLGFLPVVQHVERDMKRAQLVRLEQFLEGAFITLLRLPNQLRFSMIQIHFAPTA